MTEIVQPIPARLKNISINGHVAGTEDIVDDAKGMTQQEINSSVEDAIGDDETEGTILGRIKALEEAEPSTGGVEKVKVGDTEYSPVDGTVSLPSYPTTLPASDVYNWAKAASKPSYTKSEVGLSNVTNDSQVKRSEMGAASGVATLDSTGKVPSSQLPSYVDDVLEYDTKSAFPTTGEAGKIYVDKSNDTTWRWSGTTYTQIKGDLVIGTTTGTAADGGTASAHYSNTSNPHSVTKSQVGLGSVVNTGDSATPVSGGTTKFTTGGAYTELAKKVDKVTGKGLSTNDYTTDEKNKLAGIAAGAEVNVQSDWNATEGDAFIKNKPTIPAAVTESTVSGWGFTKNAGTITGIKMNGASKGTSGVVDLGTVITSHQDISGKVNTTTTVNGHALSSNVTVTKSDVGLGNVGNFKAVSTEASQGLTDTEKSNARANIGAGTSSFSGSYNDLTNKPTIPTAVAVKGDAETSYRTGNVNITPANIGLGNVNNTADANKSVASAAKLTTARTIWGQSFDGSGNVDGRLSITDSRNAWAMRSLTVFAPNLTNGSAPFIMVGKADSAKNNGWMTYVHKADGDNGNRLSFGLHSVDNVLNILGSGNVGIGTTSPSKKLDVNGTLNVSGNATLTSINGVTVGSSPKFTDTTYTPLSLGFCYGECSTAAGTAAKTVTMGSYNLVAHGIVSIRFTNAITVANATLNINSKGAKAIYYKGAALGANIVGAGSIVVMQYNGSQYHIVSIEAPIITTSEIDTLLSD